VSLICGVRACCRAVRPARFGAEFMRSPIGDPAQSAREIGCQFRQGTDEIVTRNVFKGCAKAAWPRNTEAEIAAIAKCSVRQAARYLSGEFDAPPIVFIALWTACLTR
jgi:hypothetical protein